MLREIISFEIRYQLKQPLFYVCFLIFFLLAFGAVTTDAVTIGESIGNLNRNAPFVAMRILLFMSVIGVFVTTAFVANSAHRDIEHNTDSLFYSCPITKSQYLGGRFAGSLAIAFAVFLGVVLAVVIGSFMPWLDADRIGPFVLGPYLFALFVLVLPNVFLTGAIFFSVTALTRSLMATYASLVAFFVAYMTAASLLSDVQYRVIASLLDPFGVVAFDFATRYWTVSEKNASTLPWDNLFLANRLLWAAVAVGILVFAFSRFRFAVGAVAGKPARAARKAAPESPAAPGVRTDAPVAAQTFGRGATLRQWLHQSRLDFVGTVKSLPFLVILFLAVLNVIGSSYTRESLYGTAVYPVTRLMLEAIEGSFLLFAVLIMTFYSGELAWRERSLKMNEVTDALPVPTSVLWASKLVALVLAIGLLLVAAMLSTIGVQIADGYYELQFPLYVGGLFLEIGIPFVLVAVLALLTQAVTSNKYAGFMVMLLYYVSRLALPALGFEHRLYQYAASPTVIYSDMNGYGHYVAPTFWFDLYWSLFAVLLLIAVHLLWPRGTEVLLAQRLKAARGRLTRCPKTAAAVVSAGFVLVGAYIFYNTNVLNRYETQKGLDARAAGLEKTYRKYERIAQPKITAVRSDVDIYPSERRVEIRGSYSLKNKTGSPIADLHVAIEPRVRINRLGIPGARDETVDTEKGYYIYRLEKPIEPGQSLSIDYDLSVINRGFTNGASNTSVVSNGTFFNQMQFFPHIGYQDGFELQDRSKRKKYGLAPVVRMPKIDDAWARNRTYLTGESDWVSFETTVSTSADQIAISPGSLRREWSAGGRRYFHYVLDQKTLGFYCWLSADYAVKRDRWKDVDIEVYYDRKHPYNVDRMIHSVKRSLDYFTASFGPYQHHQVRILEFPRYDRFAQAFPGTIPYAEGIGFIARITKEDIDYVFYVTAHEVAHQWWAHQLIGANVQGATLMSESFAQYSALMVMEKEYGREKMRKFLRYELDRYLSGRGGELIEELPLALVENQPYIHYRKGSLAMYALRDEIGEEPLNAALAQYILDAGYQEPPFTISLEFLDYLKKIVPPSRPSLVKDLFQSITLYDNRATEVSYSLRKDRKYAVTITATSRKMRADGKGRETEIPVDDWIDVGVFGEAEGGGKGDEAVLYVEKRHITSPQTTFEVVVDRLPVKAGIDPFNKLVDRNPEDNLKGAERSESVRQ